MIKTIPAPEYIAEPENTEEKTGSKVLQEVTGGTTRQWSRKSIR